MVDGNGDFIVTTDTFVVRSNNRNNNTLLVRRAVGANDTGRAAVFHGKDLVDTTCFWDGAGETTNFVAVVSAGGNTLLTCHFKNPL